MGLWLVAFFFMFVLVELVQWMLHLQLPAVPFPVYAIAGIALAAASNARKLQFDSFDPRAIAWLGRERPPASAEPASSPTPDGNR
ncbi:hypothetical protein KR51_00034230 [Rubidibacter lacunae KORDI 51-2]|uniref:Uncharacterized protein n=2 Tax=Rubidibacter TaxID=582491 RepID=U5DHQ8_9CHRO|nr:hypothetical protein KR51_00034230 [Rubidibacter lacunae KORDI 51-2]